MNIKFVIMSMFTVFALTFAACHKSGVYDPNSAKKVSDLIVPEGFDWNMSKDVSLAISSPVETSVSVFSDEACKELLATLPVSAEENSFTLNVKSGTKNLYVQYPQTGGSKKVLTAPISASRASEVEFATAKLPEETESDSKPSGGIVFYPNTEDGWGTLLFEDMWPSKGDYDFNDVAASYKIQLYTEGKGKDLKVSAMIIGLRLNALGGRFPYQLCLQIDNLKAEEIDEISEYTVSEDGSGTYTLETEGSNNALFSFDWKGKKGSTGIFYNTEKKYEVSSEDLNNNQFAFMIELKEARDLKDFTSTVFNFFIRKTEGTKTEIHLMGYLPTDEFKEEYSNVLTNNPLLLSSDTYYRTVDGFVWGLKIPANVSHAIEDTDFTRAYPDFAKWVTTGGVENQEWYNNANSSNCMKN